MQIYYINLAKRPERRAFMEEQFSLLGLVATRIEAVTPADLSDLDRADIRRLDKAASKTNAFCCTLSHATAMRQLLTGNEQFALILEDDAVLSAGLPAFLEAFEAARPSIDLLRIETARQVLRLTEPLCVIGGIGVRQAFSFEEGRAAYIVSRRAAGMVAGSREIRRVPHDIAMFDPYEKLPRRLVVRQLFPALAVQEHHHRKGAANRFESDLNLGPPMPSRQLGWRGTARRWWRAIRRDTLIAALKAWHYYVDGAKKQRIPLLEDSA